MLDLLFILTETQEDRWDGFSVLSASLFQLTWKQPKMGNKKPFSRSPTTRTSRTYPMMHFRWGRYLSKYSFRLERDNPKMHLGHDALGLGQGWKQQGRSQPSHGGGGGGVMQWDREPLWTDTHDCIPANVRCGWHNYLIARQMFPYFFSKSSFIVYPTCMGNFS